MTVSSENPRSPGEAGGSKWARTLAQFLDLAGEASRGFDYERALKYLETMEELWESKGLPAFSIELRCQLHTEKGRALTRLGRYKEAVAEYQKLLEYCQDKTMLPQRMDIFLNIGQLLIKIGELDRALGFIHRGLAGYRRLNNPDGICKSLRNLGVIYIELGEFDDAENAYEEAIEISGDNDLHILSADLYNNLGAIKNMKGDWRAALECYNRAKDVYRDKGEVRKTAYTLNNIGITLLEQGRLPEARDYFLSALQVAGTIKDESLLLIININLTDLSVRLDNTDDARRYCSAADSYLVRKSIKNSQYVETVKLAGKISLAEEDYEAAGEKLTEALDLCRELRLQFMEAEVLFALGTLYLQSERHMEALQTLEESYQLFHQLDAAGRVEKTEGLIRSTEELYLKIFEAMAAKVDRKDHYTKGHSDRVASLAMHLARRLGLSDHEIKAIVAGGLLHDIGKLKVSDNILKKAERLTPEEYAEIKKHPENGVQLLRDVVLPWDVIPLIRHHHEQCDGSGYPDGLSGETIPSGARIICLADVFDALTSERPYREAYSADKALEVMTEQMSLAFDSMMLETFVEMIKSGDVDHIINRRTATDEMYKIWAQCRLSVAPAVASREPIGA